MGWEFCTDPEFVDKLEWARELVRDEIYPLDRVCPLVRSG